MTRHATPPLLALAILACLLAGARPLVLASAPPAAASDTHDRAVVAPALDDDTAAARSLPALPTAPLVTPTAPVDLALGPCRLPAFGPACDAAADELAAYGLDVADMPAWTAFGLGHVLEATERLADAFGGAGARERRIAAFATALRIRPTGERIIVVWVAAPQQHQGNPMRGGYAADHLYFNPNTLFLDTDTPAEARARRAATIWWVVVHELAHVWDERSAPAPQDRHSARMLRWIAGEQARGRTAELPSSYALIGGPLEAFADSVAATVTSDSANRDYYGSPRDDYVRAALCEAVGGIVKLSE